MDKRLRSLSLIVYILICALVSILSVTAVLIPLPHPWDYCLIGGSIIMGGAAAAVFTASLV
ncbi:MAG: hypothetical protein J6P98_02110, partial [Clostridia bacterium]|nr:hypothetical protein [Clostridia bacterium]